MHIYVYTLYIYQGVLELNTYIYIYVLQIYIIIYIDMKGLFFENMSLAQAHAN